jgi:hypothetical protein
MIAEFLWKISTAAQDFRERQITGPDERHAIVKAPEFILELRAPEIVEHSGTRTMNTCRVSGSTCRMSSTSPG